jgi:fimbrial isopeptide formation D2 family protein/LPXTG-motif cell wall-anchored protein
MKKISKALALILAVCCLCCVPVYASAEGETIDYSKTASLSLYKYDLTKAEADNVWDTSAYVSTGSYDQTVNDALKGYAVEGVEFSYLKLGDIVSYASADSGVITLYGIADTEILTAIGLTKDNAYRQENNTYYFTSDVLNTALASVISDNAAKSSIETQVMAKGTAMELTDEYGHSQASGLALGLYLVAETKVPENVTSTVNPFLISLPMTTGDGNAWSYDVTVYPKNRTGMPTLDKGVKESGSGNDYAPSATASAGDKVDYRIVSTLPTVTSAASYLSKYSFVDELSQGISYNKNDIVISFYSDKAYNNMLSSWDESSGKFTVSYSGRKMNIDMTEAGLAEINHSYSDCTMAITYSCTLNSDVSLVCGAEGNPNTVTLTWSRTSTEYWDTLTAKAKVYSYGIDLTKKFSDGAGSFEKVKFILRNDSDNYYVTATQTGGIYYVTGQAASTEQATKFTPSADGKILIKGLENDQYTVTELATDSNYNLLKSGITVVITEDGSATVDGTGVEMSGGVVPFTVVNTKGFELPKTGSYGTWMFTVGGVPAMGAAGFAIFKLVRKKQ